MLRTGAIAIALFGSGGALAQQSVVAERMAEAKILESSGQLMKAIEKLREAAEAAPEGGAAPVQAELTALLAKMGMGGQDPQPAPAAGDPVMNLIAVLDSSSDTPEVDSAIAQLRELGELVVPYLVVAFPDLGPFGVHNALHILQMQSDPRIAALLCERLETAPAEVVDAIVRRMTDMRPNVELALAHRIAEGEFRSSHRLQALRVLLEKEPESEVCKRLRASVLEHGTPAEKAAAVFHWIEHGDVDEEAALAATARLDQRQLGLWVAGVCRAHPEWVRLGLQGFRAAVENGDDWSVLDDYIDGSFQWWRQPDQAVPLLLAVADAHRQASQGVLRIISELARNGWRASPAHDEKLAAIAAASGQQGWDLLARVLPDDAEERALALWEEYPGWRGYFVSKVTDRPWHRLVVRHLLSLDSWNAIESHCLSRDWSGAPPAAIEGLVEFANKWPARPAGYTQNWPQQLAQAFQMSPNLPIEVVQPLFRAGETDIWEAVVRRCPEQVLTLARDIERVGYSHAQTCAGLLARHGTPGDVPLALRLLEMDLGNNAYSQVEDFLGRHGGGDLAVLRLVCVPMRLESGAVPYAARAAAAAAMELKAGDVEAVLQLLPALPYQAAVAVGDALVSLVSAGHVTALGAALDRCLAREWTTTDHENRAIAVGNINLALLLIRALRETGAESAAPFLRRAFEAAAAPELVVAAAADTALQVAGSGRRKLIGDMLQSPVAQIARAALGAEELRADAGLQKLATAAVLRMAPQNSGAERVFGVLDSESRIALALSILGHPRLADFHLVVVTAALHQLDGTKDARYLTQLVRAATHPDERVRNSVAGQLGNTFVRDAAPPLLDLLRDDSSRVRAAAQASLDRIANYLDEREKWEKRFGGK